MEREKKGLIERKVLIVAVLRRADIGAARHRKKLIKLNDMLLLLLIRGFLNP